MTFVDFQTTIPADWLNNVNTVVNSVQGGLAVATNITALRAVDHTKYTTTIVRGYYNAGDNGGGIYHYVNTDVTSADNGGSIIVASDGARWYLQHNNVLSVRQFGAKADGSNDTAAIQAAFNAAQTIGAAVFFPAGFYWVKESFVGATYMISSKNTPFFGERGVTTAINVLSGASNSADVFQYTPDASHYLDFMYVRDIQIVPAASGTRYGNRCFYFNCASAATNASDVLFSNVYCAPSNGVSVEFFNDGAVNLQGCPANSTFESCDFWEGTKFTQAGDSIRFRDCVFRSSSTTGAAGVYFSAVQGAGGTSACFTMEECNSDCYGGTLFMLSGFKPSIRHNNIEQSAGPGTGSNAVIDIDGTNLSIVGAEIIGNALGVFGTSTANRFIRTNFAQNTVIENNRCITPNALPQCVLITANSAETCIGGMNQFSNNASAAISDSGIGTRGLRQAATLNTGWSNAGGGLASAACIKNKEGRVTLEGIVNHAGASSGTLIATLPASFRPLTNSADFASWGVVSGSIVPIHLQVNTSGGIIGFWTGTLTQACLGGIGFDTTSWISSNN